MARHSKLLPVLCGSLGMLALAGAGIVTSAPASATTVPNLYVAATGNDGANTCRLSGHPCATISHAVSEAPTTGATIHVGAGTFTQPLSITHSLNIVGTVQNGVRVTVINPTTTVADTDSNYGITPPTLPTPIGALVDVTNGAVVDLSNLNVNGSGASSGIGGCGPTFVGVYYHDASGSVSDVTIRGVELSQTLFGCQSGLAAYVATDASSPNPSNVTFSAVVVKAYQKNGITCNFPQTSCTVSGATVTGSGPNGQIAQNGVQIAFGASGSVTGSTITANSYTGGGAQNQATGILVYDTGATSVIGNTLSANDVDIFAGADSGAVAGAWQVEGNTTSGATDNVPSGTSGNGEGNQYGDGIQLSGATSSTNPLTVTENTSSGNFEYGIGLYGVVGATVRNNTTNANYDGIFVDSSSATNSFNGNVSKHNLRYDFEDTSTGSGTAGTADSWGSTVVNTCRPLLDSAPVGLC